MLVKLFSLAPNAGFLPVVTEMARLAASFNLLSIILEEDWWDAKDSVSLKPSPSPGMDPGPEGFLPLLSPPTAAALRAVLAWEGNFGLNSFSQYAVRNDFFPK